MYVISLILIFKFVVKLNIFMFIFEMYDARTIVLLHAFCVFIYVFAKQVWLSMTISKSGVLVPMYDIWKLIKIKLKILTCLILRTILK
jgi:hypothetical protein